MWNIFFFENFGVHLTLLRPDIQYRPLITSFQQNRSLKFDYLYIIKLFLKSFFFLSWNIGNRNFSFWYQDKKWIRPNFFFRFLALYGKSLRFFSRFKKLTRNRLSFFDLKFFPSNFTDQIKSQYMSIYQTLHEIGEIAFFVYFCDF